jgi:hypothetical protein
MIFDVGIEQGEVGAVGSAGEQDPQGLEELFAL